MRKSLIVRAVAGALLLSTIGVLSFNSEAAVASEKIKVTVLLISDNSRLTACQDSFTEATIDYARMNNTGGQAYFDNKCLIQAISNKPLSGTAYLQVRTTDEFFDFWDFDAWPVKKSKSSYTYKYFSPKYNHGKITGKKTYTLYGYKSNNEGVPFPFTVPIPGPGTLISGEDFCYDPEITNVELRVRVTSGTKQYFSNKVKISYVNADKIIMKGNTCELDTSSSSSGKSPGQGSTSGASGTSLPQCSVAQIREHTKLVKDFNEWRDMYLDSIAVYNESIVGMNKANMTGNNAAYTKWEKNLRDSMELVRSTAASAIDTQNKLITLMKQCSFNYGVIITQPYGFITTDDKFRGYEFPTFTIP